MDYPTVFMQCFDCIGRFYRALDCGDGHSAAAVFARDGLWQRGSQTLAGAAAIEDAVTHRDSNRKTAHLLSNLAVQVDADAITARYVTSVYTESEGEIVLEAILDCNDLLRVHCEELKFQSKRATVRLSGKKS